MGNVAIFLVLAMKVSMHIVELKKNCFEKSCCINKFKIYVVDVGGSLFIFPQYFCTKRKT